ncbi:hypothetical protein MSAN_00457500 [Mycena sanguinolenta]|uniref:Uncharacterized protein n=1 Tax=Mycena sanguinolenta TaxID=230812 RepID=A0A8H6ZE16_9AGAR|nr:hypothetical protein MSAN_00457500 [Mycena sanguinolenta]
MSPKVKQSRAKVQSRSAPADKCPLQANLQTMIRLLRLICIMRQLIWNSRPKCRRIRFPRLGACFQSQTKRNRVTMKFGGMLFGPPSFLPPQPENLSMAGPSRSCARPRNNRRETSDSEDNTIPASDANAVQNNKDDGEEPEDEGGMSAKA